MAIEAKAVRDEIQQLSKRISNNQTKVWNLTNAPHKKAQNRAVFKAMVRSSDDLEGKRAWLRYVRLVRDRDVVPLRRETRKMQIQRSALWAYYRSLTTK